MNGKPSVMISHAEVDTVLAAAWASLINKIFLGSIDVWYSSDDRGAFTGKASLADQIEKAIASSDVILTLQTPRSTQRPWLLWEAGLARGTGKEILIVVYKNHMGRLGNPLDIYPQTLGSKLSEVKQVLNRLREYVKWEKLPDHADSPLDEYIVKVEAWEARSGDSDTVNFDKKITIELSQSDKTKLAEDAAVPCAVIVSGDLTIFGYQGKQITWGKLTTKLAAEDARRNWPGSALRWTESLGRLIKNVLEGWISQDDPEGLPLYFDQASKISYRPSLLQKREIGNYTAFDIGFIVLPPELVARPGSNLGIFVSLCRFLSDV